MKKNLVNYDSDSDTNEKETEKKMNKKAFDYNRLPLSKSLNFKEKNLDRNSSKNTSEANDSENIQTSSKNIFNLPTPKNKANNFSDYLTNRKGENNSRNITHFHQKEQKLDEKIDFNSQQNNIKLNDNDNDYIQNQNIETEEKQDNIEENSGENTENLMMYLNKRDKNNKKNMNIQEIKGKDLLDFDWHGYRERQKIKKETSFHKNMKAPNKVQKTKHQLTYLAYEAISKQEEIENRKMEARKNHLLTQQKYGW